MKNRNPPPPVNVEVMSKGSRYRVCFNASRRILAVCRKTPHGEVALEMSGRRAKEIIKQVHVRWEAVADARTAVVDVLRKGFIVPKEQDHRTDAALYMQVAGRIKRPLPGDDTPAAAVIGSRKGNDISPQAVVNTRGLPIRLSRFDARARLGRMRDDLRSRINLLRRYVEQDGPAYSLGPQVARDAKVGIQGLELDILALDECERALETLGD